MLADRLASKGLDPKTSVPESESHGPVSALAVSLLQLERLMAAERPSLVVLADGGDHALAAALVATKLLVPVVRLDEPGPGGAESGNDGLLDLLADTVPIEALPTLLRP